MMSQSHSAPDDGMNKLIDAVISGGCRGSLGMEK